jgi:hypothetical protein
MTMMLGPSKAVLAGKVESDETLVEVPSDAAAAEIQGDAPESVVAAAESQNGASDGAVS